MAKTTMTTMTIQSKVMWISSLLATE